MACWLNVGDRLAFVEQKLHHTQVLSIRNLRSMRKHNGMRPQDVLILLKLITLGDQPWRYADVAKALRISQSEVAEGLHRSQQARLVDPSKRKVHRASLLEFLVHGLKYVFPAQPGPITRGVPTAHSAAPLSRMIVADQDAYVWPSERGSLRGQAIPPLYPSAIEASERDSALYELLSLIDALRVGRTREQKIAIAALTQRIKEEDHDGKDHAQARDRSHRLR